MTNKRYTITLEEDPQSGDLILPFPPEMLEELGWKEGDVLQWHSQEDGSYMITKKDSNG